jgi:hypothetical protein
MSEKCGTMSVCVKCQKVVKLSKVSQKLSKSCQNLAKNK